MQDRLKLGLGILLTMSGAVHAMGTDDATELASSINPDKKRSNDECQTSSDNTLEISSAQDPKKNIKKRIQAPLASPPFLSLAQDSVLDAAKIDDTRSMTSSVATIRVASVLESPDWWWQGMEIVEPLPKHTPTSHNQNEDIFPGQRK